jgi:hypothetical protein
MIIHNLVVVFICPLSSTFFPFWGLLNFCVIMVISHEVLVHGFTELRFIIFHNKLLVVISGHLLFMVSYLLSTIKIALLQSYIFTVNIILLVTFHIILTIFIIQLSLMHLSIYLHLLHFFLLFFLLIPIFVFICFLE